MDSPRFARFKLGKLLGKGAFGYVYETEMDNDSRTRFAIKIVDKKRVAKRGSLDRIRTEIHIHQRLKHPNILSLYTFHEDQDYFYLVTELCSRGELYNHLKNDLRRPMSEMECHWYIHELVQGIEYLHGNGIIHRDLKLSNLLITDKYRLKIAYFGLAVYLSDKDDDVELTMCGTPNYLSPEVLSRERYGFSVDMWSIGVIAYTLMVGRPPFEGKSVQETLDRIMDNDLNIPSILSSHAQDFIRRLLQRDTSKRLDLEQLRNHPFLTRYPIDLGPCRNIGHFPSGSAQYATRLGRISVGDKRIEFQLLDGFDRVVVDRDEVYVERRGKRLYFQTLKYSQSSGIPVPLVSVYRLVGRLVDEIKEKTVGVVLETRNAKCSFMLNDPEPDCVVEFRIPRRISCFYSPRKSQMVVTKTDDTRKRSCVIDLARLSELDGIYSTKILRIVDHARKYYSLYLDLGLNKHQSLGNPYVYRYENEMEDVSMFRSTSTIEWNSGYGSELVVVRCVIDEIENVFEVHYNDNSTMVVNPIDLCVSEDKKTWSKIDRELNTDMKNRLGVFRGYVLTRLRCG